MQSTTTMSSSPLLATMLLGLIAGAAFAAPMPTPTPQLEVPDTSACQPVLGPDGQMMCGDIVVGGGENERTWAGAGAGAAHVALEGVPFPSEGQCDPVLGPDGVWMCGNVVVEDEGALGVAGGVKGDGEEKGEGEGDVPPPVGIKGAVVGGEGSANVELEGVPFPSSGQCDPVLGPDGVWMCGNVVAGDAEALAGAEGGKGEAEGEKDEGAVGSANVELEGVPFPSGG
jgi:hypothetical protein